MANVGELTYEAWRITYQSSEQAARAAFAALAAEKARADAAEADARRWRWVRERWAQLVTTLDFAGSVKIEARGAFANVEPERVDAAIDTALQAGVEGQ